MPSAPSPLPEWERNNFTALRVGCALLVLVGHFLFLNVPPAALDRHFHYPFAEFGVQAFFVTSGFLVAGSFEREGRLWPFYLRRFFRIYPLYLAVLLVQAMAMTALLLQAGSLPLGELVRYVGWNAVFANFLAPAMGKLLDPLVDPGINPSLWTLKIELMFYAVLPLLHRLHLRFWLPFLVALFLASTLYYVQFSVDEPVLARQLPGQLRYFICGMALWYWRDQLAPQPGHPLLLLAMTATAGVMLAIDRGGLVFDIVRPVAVSAFVFTVALCLPFRAKVPDLSYGLYLWHGPLIQLALLTGLYRADALGLATIALAATALAWLGWRFVEQPFIAFGRQVVAGKARSLGPSRLPEAMPERGGG